VNLVSGKNIDAYGTFNFDQSTATAADSQKVNGNNPQATSATVAATLVGAYVADGSQANPNLTCDSTFFDPNFPTFSCSSLTSQWSEIQVGNGKDFNNTSGGPGIKVMILFQQLPTGLSGSTPVVYHTWMDSFGTQQSELVYNSCTYDNGGLPTNSTPCLTVGNKMVTVWLFHNGGTRM
jgi:hypothetical protein